MARGSGTTTKQVDDLRQQLAEALAAQQAAEQALAAVQRSKEGSKVGSSESVGQDDEESSKAPPFKIGLGPADKADPLTQISNGAGDLAVVDQLVRAVQHGLVPPVACFTEAHLYYLKSHNVQFLPPAHRPIDDETKRQCLKAWAPVHEVEHLIPLDRFLPAFLKLIATVRATICEDKISREYVQEDVDHFLDGLFRRLGNDGDLADRSRNFLSSWSEAYWTQAKQMAGAPSRTIPPRLESAGNTKTAWGLLTSLGYDETKQELLKRIVDEDCNIIGRAVLAGEQPEGEIPPSLDYTPAYAYASEEAQRAASWRRLNSGEEEEEEEEEDAHFRYQIGGTMVMIDPFGRTAGSRSFD